MNQNRLTQSPFQDPSETPEVFVTAGRGPYTNTRTALEHIDLSISRGKRVLLKPNAGRVAPPGSGITTDPQVIAAAIDVFRKVGAEVAVGESPIVGVKAHEAFDSIGITSIARERDCPLIDMNIRHFIF